MERDHKGQPSGSNKEEGSEIKPVMSTENLEGSEDISRKTDDKNESTENLNVRHPNRNEDKEDSTNAER